MTLFSFDISAIDGSARRGRMTTAHGAFETPAFAAAATAATVKGMLPEAVTATGAELALCNTYHLMLRPGAERVAALGGLHKFMNWTGPILTDSGGYQVMSLAKLRDIDEEGVVFRSHLDGSEHRLTPERAMHIQHQLDADITMCLDECVAHPATEEQTALSMRRSMRWAARCKAAFVPRAGYALFGINQGGVYPDLRAESAAALTDIGFDGYALGGLAVGEGQETMFRICEATVPLLPQDKPRYLMGVGKPDDVVGAVLRGIDMFDCVMPTRSGRTGQGFTRRGPVNIRNARHIEDPRPLDEQCPCPACRQYSRAYIHHLFRCEEMLGPILLTWHNLQYYQDLMRALRRAIEEKRLAAFAAEFTARQAAGDVAGKSDMRHRKIIAGVFLLVLFAFAPAHAVDETENGSEGIKTGSGLPIPRFASLHASDVNLRTGPGTRYPIDWVFTHQGMPVEITAEYEMWRRVRDAEGDEGWVHKNALSGKRAAIVTGGMHELRRDPDANAAIAAHLEAGAVGQLVSCARDWCKLKFEGAKGYLRKSEFWGAYEGEVFD